MRGTPEERFLNMIDKQVSGCWVWVGYIDAGGYGMFRVGGSMVRPHRFSYSLYVGPIEEGLSIDHLCGVRTCCNPAHLEPVTHKVNNSRRRPPPFVPLVCLVATCSSKVVAIQLCMKHYDLKRGGRGRIGRATELDRFWAKVDKSGECWEWTASKGTHGYGMFRGSGHSLAHRWSYSHEVGEIPEGWVVDHLCHNRACVRPVHLEAVSRETNSVRRAGLNSNNSSGVRGVTFDKGYKSKPWMGHVVVGGKQTSKHFKTKEEATEYVSELRKELHP